MLVFLVSLAATSRAWDSGGHEIIAAIAYAHLNPKARAAVDRLAPQISRPAHPYDPITLACWMDDIRHDQSLADYGKFKSWHYIDLPLDSRDPTPSFEPGNDNEINGDAVQGLKRARVEHLVGDIHQPLHCATKYFFSHGEWRDDKGGNDEFVLNGPPGDDKFNLHAFWDSAWRASFDDATGNVVLNGQSNPAADLDSSTLHDLATSLDHATTSGGEDLAPNFDAWARESNALARAFVYPGITATDNKKYCRLGSTYVAHARGLALKRLALAGHRLAALLNATLGSPTPLNVPPPYPAGPPAESY
jgi:hypothetical protein